MANTRSNWRSTYANLMIIFTKDDLNLPEISDDDPTLVSGITPAYIKLCRAGVMLNKAKSYSRDDMDIAAESSAAKVQAVNKSSYELFKKQIEEIKKKKAESTSKLNETITRFDEVKGKSLAELKAVAERKIDPDATLAAIENKVATFTGGIKAVLASQIDVNNSYVEVIRSISAQPGVTLPPDLQNISNTGPAPAA